MEYFTRYEYDIVFLRTITIRPKNKRRKQQHYLVIEGVNKKRQVDLYYIKKLKNKKTQIIFEELHILKQKTLRNVKVVVMNSSYTLRQFFTKNYNNVWIDEIGKNLLNKPNFYKIYKKNSIPFFIRCLYGVC